MKKYEGYKKALSVRLVSQFLTGKVVHIYSPDSIPNATLNTFCVFYIRSALRVNIVLDIKQNNFFHLPTSN